MAGNGHDRIRRIECEDLITHHFPLKITWMQWMFSSIEKKMPRSSLNPTVRRINWQDRPHVILDNRVQAKRRH
jgi:hypothetical protein